MFNYLFTTSHDIIASIVLLGAQVTIHGKNDDKDLVVYVFLLDTVIGSYFE